MRIAYKKIWIILSLLIAGVLVAAFTLPLQSNVKETIQFSANTDALFRQLLRDTTWHHWWPGKTGSTGQKVTFNQGEFTFTFESILLNTFVLTTTSDSFSTNSSLQLIPEAGNKVTITLITGIQLDKNPITRIKLLFLSTRLKDSYKKILWGLSYYFTNQRNLYGIDIKELKVPFEYVTTISQTFKHKPSLSEIYLLIDQVKNYIKKEGAEEKGYPMLYTDKMSSEEYFVQVGIPIEKSLPENEKIKSKWMLKGGNILSAEIVGNRKVIKDAVRQMEYYIQDNHRNVVAISYESLITNRLEQPDSNKWVTRIYFPVI